METWEFLGVVIGLAVITVAYLIELNNFEI